MSQPSGDERPLEGRFVLVTRPRAQAAELIALLEAAGADVVVAPTIRIVPPADPRPLQHAAADLAQFDWIVFSSANAVDALLAAIPGGDGMSGRDAPGADATTTVNTTTNVARTLSGLRQGSGPARRSGAEAAGPRNAGRSGTLPKIAAVGTRTAERLRARGYEVALVPDEFTAEGLVSTLTAQTKLGGARVLLPRSEIGRDVVADGLRAAGAVVTDVIAYRTVAAPDTDEAGVVRRMLTERRLDAVTFTSGSAVQNFVQMYGLDLLRDTIVAAIGPVTAEAARQLGLSVHVQPETYTTAAMVDALSRHFARRA